MRTSSSPQTTTTTSEPPRYLQPYLQEGLNQSRNLYYGTPGAAPMGGSMMGAAPNYGSGPIGRLIAQAQASGNWGTASQFPMTTTGTPSGFPEAPVIPFSPQTQTALDMTEQRALSGSPVTGAAQDYATKTLGGGFMGSNPWLDRTFNRAAGAVTNQVQSNFGLAGRNPRGVDAAGFAGDLYSNLATDIYGGDYQAERARQQQLVPFAGQLAAQDYADIGQLANVGAQYEDLARERANASDLALDQYLARLSGFPGSTVTATTPMERNRLAGALGGASMGSMFGPWGILGGGILGGILG